MQTLFFQRFDQHYAPRTGAKRSMSDIASSDQVSEIARSEPGIGGMPCLADYMIYQQDPANGSNAMAHLLLLSHDNAVTMEDVHIF